MKKILFFLLIVTSLFGGEVKESWFIGGSFGELTIVDNDNTQNYAEGKVGFYFYDENIYSISNRIYLSGSKVFSDNTSFYTGKLSLDWLYNDLPLSFIRPFIGISGGYTYYAYGKNNYSTPTYGMQAGLLLYLGQHIELELGGSSDKATDNTEVWTKAFKKLFAGINISF
jgi:hypothetical protein